MGSSNDRTAGCPEPLTAGSLLRAAADGELSIAQRARLEEHLAAHPEDEARIGFEQGLRECCGRVMGAPRCPDALRARISAMRSLPAHASPTRAAGNTPAVVIEDLPPLTRSRSFWQRPAVRGTLALAALVALAAAGVFVSGAIRGGTASPALLAGGGGIQQVAFTDKVAGFVAREHRRCWESQLAAERKFVVTESDRAVARVREVLGPAVRLAALEQPAENLVFRGVGDCRVPGSNGKSVHMRFDVPANDTTPATAVSVFAAPDSGELPIREGVTYSVNTARCGEAGTTVLVWTQDGTVFYLVADTVTGACNKMLTAMGLTAPSEGL